MYANGYKYWLAYKKGSSGYYRCCRYKNSCPGRCVLDEDGVIRNTTAHNHPPEADRLIVDRFRKVLTQRAASEKTDLHVIYLEEATNRHSDASLLYTFSLAESCMKKARRKQHPQEPASIHELKDTLENSELFRIHNGHNRDAFYQITINLEDTVCVVLWHSRTVEALGKIEELYVDCSLDVETYAPQRYHLLVGIDIHQQSCVPIFYSIMTAKTYSGFAAIFAYIREQMGILICPTIILTQADGMVHNALEITFPEATIKVFWYHYTEAVLKQMRQLGLGRETTKGHPSSGLRMLLVLPLLPANYMTPGLEALKKWMKEKNIFTQSFCQLCDYVEQSWLGAVGAKKLSMFGQPYSLSSQTKGYLKELADQEGLQNSSIWQLLETLTQLATKQFVKLSKKNKRTLQSGQPAKPIKKIRQVQETVISNATQMWIKTAVHLRNPLQFLQLCSHCINDAMIMESIPIPISNSKPKMPSIVEPAETVGYANSQSGRQLVGSDLQTSQHVQITLPLSDPPPLAFFPKVALNRTESSRTTNISYNQAEPPPLVPFSVPILEPQGASDYVSTSSDSDPTGSIIFR